MDKRARNIEHEDPATPAGTMDEQPLNRSGGENPEGDDHQGVPPGIGKTGKRTDEGRNRS